MSNSFQSEIPKARINLKLDVFTGRAQKKAELPLKLVVSGDFSNGRKTAPLSERNKVNINKLNMQQVLAEFAPATSFDVKHTNGDEETEEKINLTFRHMKDFTPEQIARRVPRLQAMRNLRANLLDDAGFRRELLNILRDPTLSDELRAATRWLDVMQTCETDTQRYLIRLRQHACLSRIYSPDLEERLDIHASNRAVSRTQERMGLNRPKGAVFRTYTKST